MVDPGPPCRGDSFLMSHQSACRVHTHIHTHILTHNSRFSFSTAFLAVSSNEMHDTADRCGPITRSYRSSRMSPHLLMKVLFWLFFPLETQIQANSCFNEGEPAGHVALVFHTKKTNPCIFEIPVRSTVLQEGGLIRLFTAAG